MMSDVPCKPNFMPNVCLEKLNHSDMEKICRQNKCTYVGPKLSHVAADDMTREPFSHWEHGKCFSTNVKAEVKIENSPPQDTNDTNVMRQCSMDTVPLNGNNGSQMRYKCKSCGWEVQNFPSLQLHYCHAHEVEILNGNQILNKDRHHYRILSDSLKRRQEKLSCPECGRVLLGAQSFATHVENHSTFKHMYKCQIIECGYMYEKFSTLKSHYSKVHNELVHFADRKTFECKLQAKCESDAETETDSEEVEILNAFRECPVCLRRLKASGYTYHVNNHDKMIYKCQFASCGWMFEYFHHLQVHHQCTHQVKIKRVEEHHDRVGTASTVPVHTLKKKPMKKKSNHTPCPLCGRRFLGKVMYAEHVDNHSTMKYMYKCQVGDCGYMYENYRSFVDHNKRVHHQFLEETEGKYRCYLQDGGAESEEDDNSTKSSDEVCPTCGLLCLGGSLQRHMDDHRKMKYQCPEASCRWMSNSQAMLKIHYATQHKMDLSDDSTQIPPKQQNFICCKICSRQFRKDHVRDQHVKEHDKMKFTCQEPGCGWMYEHYSGYKDHLHRVHKLKVSNQIRIEKSGKVNIDARIVSLQEKNRPDSSWKECLLCRRMLTKDKYDYHVFHHDRMRYECFGKGCGWRYDNFTSLESHSWSKHGHSALARKKCSICNQTLSVAKYFNHVKNHWKPKFICKESYCKWKFEKFSRLKDHYLQSHGLTIDEKKKQAYKLRKLPRVDAKRRTESKELVITSTQEPNDTPTDEATVLTDEDNTNSVTSSIMIVENSEVRNPCVNTCSECSRQFASTEDCDKHMKRHRYMRYKCIHLFCGWMFEQYHMLQWHYADCHSTAVTQAENVEQTEGTSSASSSRLLGSLQFTTDTCETFPDICLSPKTEKRTGHSAENYEDAMAMPPAKRLKVNGAGDADIKSSRVFSDDQNAEYHQWNSFEPFSSYANPNLEAPLQNSVDDANIINGGEIPVKVEPEVTQAIAEVVPIVIKPEEDTSCGVQKHAAQDSADTMPIPITADGQCSLCSQCGLPQADLPQENVDHVNNETGNYSHSGVNNQGENNVSDAIYNSASDRVMNNDVEPDLLDVHGNCGVITIKPEGPIF